MSIQQPKFDVPRTRTVTLTRPVFVKGKGLPKDGVCLFSDGEEVQLHTDNGSSYYLLGSYKGQPIRVATIPSTL